MAGSRHLSEQLPKWQPWTAERWIALLGGVAGICALFVTFFKLDALQHDTQTRIFVAELSALCVFLAGYLVVLTRKKLHRYAQAAFYLHYINHIIRDEIATKEPDLDRLLQEAVNAVANCFSVLNGRRCRACIQEILPDRDVRTIVRDDLTSAQSADTDSERHNIEDNSDYADIWYGRNGCHRYFLSNDLEKLWRSGRYRNSSFLVHGEPTTAEFLRFSWVTRWPLPYKATIVWPIRYVPDGTKWPALNARPHTEKGSSGAEKRPFVWGFLCVDSGSRNTFNPIYAPELGAAFADALFTLLDAALMKSGKSSPNGDRIPPYGDRTVAMAERGPCPCPNPG